MIDSTSLQECIVAAEHLFEYLSGWLSENRNDLLR